MQEKKVSIIVPVYNVEKYLRECLDSIIKQTYFNLEIIVIDDGSSDGSSKICDEYGKKDSRVRVVHKVNGGAASARNLALDKMTGDYVCFVDSDDYISEAFVQELVYNIEKENADIAECSLEYIYLDKVIKHNFDKPLQIFSCTDYLQKFLVDWTCALTTNKIFKVELLEGLYYEEGHKIDDEFFTYKVVMNAKKIAQFSKILYSYRMRKSSVTKDNKVAKLRLKDQIDFLEERYENIKINYPELKKAYMEHMADNFIQFFRSELLDREIRRYLKKVIRKYLLDFITVSYFCVLKMWIVFYYCFSSFCPNKKIKVLQDENKYFE